MQRDRPPPFLTFLAWRGWPFLASGDGYFFGLILRPRAMAAMTSITRLIMVLTIS